MTRMFALMLAITLLAGCSPPARVAAAVSAQGPPVGLLRVAWRAEDVPAPRHRLAVDGDRVMAISDTGVTA